MITLRRRSDTAMRLSRSDQGVYVERDDECIVLRDVDWQPLICRDDLHGYLVQRMASRDREVVSVKSDIGHGTMLPVIGDKQELWAAGVTYFRSRTARMQESAEVGGDSFYDRVYNADRPELFMKATPHRVVGQGGTLRLRRDSKWMVPEPELTLLISPNGKIIGYTAGNDLSCRDIEGENPLYLPQAKTFDGCAAVGPAICVIDSSIAKETAISIVIDRAGATVFEDATDLSQLKRSPETLVEYLFRECSFPHGCLLMTGTGLVPPDDFTLHAGDRVSITIDGVGTLTNQIA